MIDDISALDRLVIETDKGNSIDIVMEWQSGSILVYNHTELLLNLSSSVIQSEDIVNVCNEFKYENITDLIAYENYKEIDLGKDLLSIYKSTRLNSLIFFIIISSIKHLKDY